MKSTAKNQGFTLIEIMVAVSIFVIVALVATGALFALSQANKKAQNIKTAIDNMNFTINSMAVRIREGSGAEIDVSNSSHITFNDFDGNLTEYDLSNGCVRRFYGGSRACLTPADKVMIDKLEFKPVPHSSLHEQLGVIIRLEGRVSAGKKGETIFRLQTAVSQRNTQK